MKRIGILGGLGPESTAVYYEYITREYYRRYRNYAYPEIIIYSFSFQEFIDAGYEASGKVKMAIENLHKAGADFVIAACNSLHIVFEEVSGNISIPWLSIIDAAAQEIKTKNIKKVGLLGTIFTMNKDFYRKGLARHNIETIIPSGEDRVKINNIIYKELVLNEIRDDSRQIILEIIRKLSRRGAEGVVLGCTELPFLIRQKDTSVKVFDTTTIHTRKALQIALGEEEI
ncbi:MAG: amino acid racemase [Spirochaetes bacterium]|nr:amino acid racemase [Spirochaetota bacterium]